MEKNKKEQRKVINEKNKPETKTKNIKKINNKVPSKNIKIKNNKEKTKINKISKEDNLKSNPIVKKNLISNKKTNTEEKKILKHKKIKSRVNKTYTQKDKKAKIMLILLLIFIIILIHFLLGWFFSLTALLGSLIIIGFNEILKNTKNKKSGLILKIFIILFLITAIAGISGFGYFLYYIKTVSDPIYDVKKLETPENTTFLDINGLEYAKLGTEIRQKVTYDELPEVLIDAIVATEDSRFFQHNGFDAPRFMKATIGQLLGKKSAGGASTITMQIAKNSFTNPYETSGAAGIIRKFKDIYLSIFKLEKDFTKEKIIEFYVNNHYLGGNIYGVQEASEAYFGKDVSELNLSEAAIIAGMFKSPVYYRPTVHPDHAEERRNVVLYLMNKHGYITKEEKEMAEKIKVETLTQTKETAQNNKYSGFIDTVVAEIDKKYDGLNAYKVPLLVYTTLDRNKQDAVNSVFNGESYNWINDKVQAGVSVIDTNTGKILAIGNGRYINGRVPGRKNITNYATGIHRQPGSTAKPIFDYGPGIEYNNWSTYTLFKDEPYAYSNGRPIKNWDNGYFGTITMRKALASSRNIPALKAFQMVDNKKIIEFVTKLGLSPEISGGHIHEAHSIGAFDPGTNPLEMSAAYSAFANGGIYHEPYSVSKIIFKADGKEMEHEKKSVRAMSEATAFMITSILQDVALTGGTPRNVACKTGTTNYDIKTMQSKHLPGDAIRDSWVVGYSRNTAVALWYGYDYIDSEYCLRNIPATIQKDRIFNALVNSGAMESNRQPFKQPSSVSRVEVVVGSDPPKIPGAYKGPTITEYFKKGYEPDEVYEEEKLEKPNNLKVTYNENNKHVTISWDPVKNSDNPNQTYGSFGYNIYLNGTLIDFTESTNYKFSPSNPYGTYKIIASYKGYSGVQSEAAVYELKEKPKHDEIQKKLSMTYIGKTEIEEENLTLNYSDFKIKLDNKEINATISSCDKTTITEAGETTITCKIIYEKETYTVSTTITFTK